MNWPISRCMYIYGVSVLMSLKVHPSRSISYSCTSS
uniref:Uncharacterized protein n=1 Tax=Arundo donax TaxID=35708 RepID=A0A0A9ER80_ARUDO